MIRPHYDELIVTHFDDLIETHFVDYLMSTQCDEIVNHCQQNCVMRNDSLILIHSLDIVVCSLDSEHF